MKKAITIAIVSLVCLTGLFAFEGNTSASFAYDYEDGKNYLGIASDSTGYFGTSSFGYYAGVDALFNVKDINDWCIGLLIGPSYCYKFGESGVNLNVALGLSGEGTPSDFSCGLGAFIGAEWKLTKNFGFGVGTKIGNDFITVPFDGSGISMKSSFFVTPYLGVELYY